MTADHDLPPHLEPLYSRPAISQRLETMAPVVDEWAITALQETGHPLLAICLLRGGVFVFADLLLRLRQSVEPAFCRAWSYAKGVNSRPEENVRLDWQGVSVRGRDVVFIDNICDSGRTLAVTSVQAEGSGAHRVRSVVMVHRLRADALHTPTLTGFTYEGEEWLVGYGMRDGEAMANHPAIHRVRCP